VRFTIRVGDQMFDANDVVFVDKVTTLVSDGGGSDLLIDLRMQRRPRSGGWPNWAAPMTPVRLRCLGAQEVRLGPLADRSHQVTGFDIVPAAKAGSKDRKYAVVDYEEALFNWFCRDVIVEETSAG